ncbi:MAG: class I SAM-dependent methyltransferase [Steroidobacteraceae bacterium]
MTEAIAAPCPVCRAQGAKPYAPFEEFTWLRCSCGAIFKVVPKGPARVIGEGAFGESGYGQRYRANNRRRIGKSVRQIRDALEFVDPRARTAPARLLDVGCSLGYTLEAARELGLDPTGVDISSVAVEHCRSLGFQAQVAGLDELPFPDRHFSVVVMKHVLEHTITPDVALREAKRVLREGGALFIAVPHAGYRKAVRNPSASRFYRPDAHGGVEHWVYYTPETLGRLLKEQGFTVRSVHPLLVHPRQPGLATSVEWLTAPLRAPVEALRSALAIRKEFWIVATIQGLFTR